MLGEAELVARLAVATGLGFAVGLERRVTGQAAGERTFALIALGSCLFTLAGVDAAGEDSPTRIAAQVVTGVGFLGAGLIFHRESGGPRGLTTAAAVWSTAALGVAVGVGRYVLALSATGLGLAVLLLGPVVTAALGRRDEERPRSSESEP
jgi:putative Mg2+ transporter-C (MgtC) family protein